MIELAIDSSLKSAAPHLAVGFVTASIRVTPHDDALWREIETVTARFRGTTMDAARKWRQIKAIRDTYRALGNDPTRYRGSAEALVRRLVQGKELYRVNTVVDINNLLSLETLCSAGTFDLDEVLPPIVFRAGRPGEAYAGIGRGEIKLDGLPVFADTLGPFASTTSDSERAMIRLDTGRIMTVIISFLGTEGLAQAAARAAALFERYAAGRDMETGVVE